MNKILIAANSSVTETDLASTRLSQRFGRLDLQSQLALLAVAALKLIFPNTRGTALESVSRPAPAR